jgi:hypothetical protein
LDLALAAIDEGHKLARVAEHYGIPRTTLRDHMNGKIAKRKKGPQGVLTKEEEEGLVTYMKEMVRWGHGLSPRELRLKVAEMTQQRETPFTNDIPGESWLRLFKNRHPEFTLRNSEALEVGRAKGLCPLNVASFYENLTYLYSEHNYGPDQIWNVDESGA